MHLPKALLDWGLVGSTSEARRLVAQGGVKVDGTTATGLDVARTDLAGTVVQAGKRRFARVAETA